MNDKLICSRDKISSIASALRERTNTNGTYTLDTMSNIISNIGNKNIVNITGLTPGEILNVSKGSYSTTITADEDGNASFISYELGTYKFESQLTSRIAQINLTNIFGITLSRLPAAYQEVEYLQSTGTQYISTNFYYDGVDDKQLRLVWYPTASMAGKAISGYEQSGVAMR